MNDIIAMHRADLVDAVTEAVKPLKAERDALAAELAKISRELEVQKGVVEFVYIPVRHMTERADKYESKSKRFEAALREIASYQGRDEDMDINAKHMRDAAREALGSELETICESDKGCNHCGSMEVNPDCPECQGIER